MQIAFVSPVSVQRWTQDYTFYFMVFPNELQRNADYARFYRKACGVPANFITLNTFGEGVNEDALIRWVRMLRPAEMVLPNTHNDREATLEQAKYYIRLCYKYCNENNLPKHFMVVPQGRNKDEWFASLHDLLALGGKSTVGITPKLSFVEDRLEILDELRTITKNKHVHLFGNVDIARMLKAYKWVRSFDTKQIALMSREKIVYPSDITVTINEGDDNFFSLKYTKDGVITFRNNMHYIKGVLGHYNFSRGM